MRSAVDVEQVAGQTVGDYSLKHGGSPSADDGRRIVLLRVNNVVDASDPLAVWKFHGRFNFERCVSVFAFGVFNRFVGLHDAGVKVGGGRRYADANASAAVVVDQGHHYLCCHDVTIVSIGSMSGPHGRFGEVGHGRHWQQSLGRLK